MQKLPLFIGAQSALPFLSFSVQITLPLLVSSKLSNFSSMGAIFIKWFAHYYKYWIPLKNFAFISLQLLHTLKKNSGFRKPMDIVKVRGFYLRTCDTGHCCPSPVCLSLFQLRVHSLGEKHQLPRSNSFCCLALKREDS